MADFKIPWKVILEMIVLILRFIASGMSESEAVREAADIKGVPFGEAMSAWRQYK